MKTLKKLSCIALILVLVLGLMTTALAANVTIQLPKPDENTDPNATENYTAYKIFDADVAGEIGDKTITDPTGTGSTFDHVAYSITEDSPFYAKVNSFPGITLTPIADKTYNVSVDDRFSAPDFAIALQAVVNAEGFAGKVEATGTATLEKDATLELGEGYFLIVGSLGSKAILDTVGQEDMTIITKNEYPTLTKKVLDGEEYDKSTTASYGETVTFKIDVKIPETAVGDIVVHDTMDTQLSYGNLTTDSFPVSDVSTGLTDGCTMEFTISAEQVEANKVGTGTGTVTIIYTATLNADAKTGTAIVNTAYLTSNSYTSKPDSAEVYTYEFDLVKTTSDGTVLPGATFELYETANAEEAIVLIQNGTTYRPATDEEIADETVNRTTTITAGNITVMGLGNGTYYLEELEAPDGYNKVDGRIPVVIDGANLTATIEDGKYKADAEDDPETEGIDESFTNSGIQVVNYTGAELPSTGGIGTTIFYIVGGLLVVGACVLLVTRKRVND